MNTARLMTTILPMYYHFLEKESKRLKTTKRMILEQSIELYIKEQKRLQMKKEYERMSQDSTYLQEQTTMAELGMNDYTKLLTEHE